MQSSGFLNRQIDVATYAAYFARTIIKTGGDLRSKIVLPELYPLQQKIKEEAARYNVICIGRRAGKTYLCTYLALETLLQGYPVGWFVPTYKIANDVWRTVVKILRPITVSKNASDKQLELKNGAVLDIWTLKDEDAGRSRKYKRAILDEPAQVPGLYDKWYKAIRPTLGDLQGDAWFPGTPRGLNDYYKLYGFGLDPARKAWKSWQLPSSVNPYWPEGELDEIKADTPEDVFRQEYLAEFLDNEGAVFRNIDACLTDEPTTPKDHVGHQIYGGLDWAKQNDFTVLSLYCCNCNREVLLDRFNGIGWELQRGRVLADCDLWGVKAVMAETNSIGSPLLSRLHIESENAKFYGFETTSKTKPPLIQTLALSLERNASIWTDDAVARMEMVAFEGVEMPSGYIKYAAPEGGHDDTVIARALAWHIAKNKLTMPISIESQINALIPMHRQLEQLRADGGGSIMPHDQLAFAMAHSQAKQKVESNRLKRWNDSDEGDELESNTWGD